MEGKKARCPSDDPRLRLQEQLGEYKPTTTQDPNPLRGGILCPNCGCAHHSVSNTYQSEYSGKHYIRRRRICENCKLPFTTREVVEPELPDEIRSPAQAAKVQKIINSTMRNVIPELPANPFL